MKMIQVKIISNPYLKEITYYLFNSENNEWEKIEFANNPKSKLISKELTNGFFPFIVKKIVDVIIAEYSVAGEKIKIIFEGTKDEYKDLSLICEDYTEKVELEASPAFLENASDILPDIKTVFSEIVPLVKNSVGEIDEINENIVKFTEAADDIIPICIIGNYSSGKSTFINSLIGREILPSGDLPVTAMIFKIKKSKDKKKATVRFDYDGQIIEVQFNGDEYFFAHGEKEGAFFDRLASILENGKSMQLDQKISKVIDVINNCKRHDHLLSDIIEIEVPFNSGVLKDSEHSFIIFDTPGSNSASNENHSEILKTAMENLSNGLPLYVTEYKSLDTVDNMKLYEEIKSIDAIDDRFTMIIVNKADNARLPADKFDEYQIEDILSEALPRNMYSEGIFFVSSIVGLGAKNNGELADEFYGEIFDGLKQKYSDPENRYYKTLYQYNIMPEQLKAESLRTSSECKDLMYANSGLYAVENEIETFADKYSSYNKCQQASMFLNNVVSVTEREINRKQDDRTTVRREMREKLEQDKNELIDRLAEENAELKVKSFTAYEPYMADIIEDSKKPFTLEEVKEVLKKIVEEQRKLTGFNNSVNQTRNLFAHISKNFLENLKEIHEEKDLDSLYSLFREFKEDVKNTQDKANESEALKKEYVSKTSEELVKQVKEDFDRRFNEANEILFGKSKEYWNEKMDLMKDSLIDIVTNSEALSEENRQELTGIINSYEKMEFDSRSEEIFITDDFEYRIILFDMKLFASDYINVGALTKTYNSELNKNIDSMYSLISDSHFEGYVDWSDTLLQLVIDNIIKFNPDLRRLSNIIGDLTEQINDLEIKGKKLRNYADEINQMMSWKTGD